MSRRPIAMKTALITLALSTGLVACGSETGDGGASGQDPSSAAPAATPTGPPWPAFPHEDYTFVFSHSCFCADAGVRIEVTVVDGEAVDAVYAESGRGVRRGEPASQEWQQITIDDVIDHANTEDAAAVRVRWPAGQDHPDRVWVDRDERMADEELGYTIHRVTVG